MSDSINHECGIALIRLKKPLEFYLSKYGTSAYGLQKLNIKGDIYLPENAAKSKIAVLEDYNARVKFHGTDCVATEIHARQEAEEKDLIFISPYNDPQIIGGQGTIGIEILQQLPTSNSVFVPVGGGDIYQPDVIPRPDRIEKTVASYLYRAENRFLGVKRVNNQPLEQG